MGLFEYFLGSSTTSSLAPASGTFWEACEDGDVHRVSSFLRKPDFDPNAPDAEGQTGFIRACRSGRSKVVDLLLADTRVDPCRADVDGATGFLEACLAGQTAVVRALLASGKIDPNDTDAVGRTGLMLACRHRRLASISALLADGRVAVNGTGDRGVTALWESCRKGLVSVVRLLLSDPRADRNLGDEYGQTPLMLACTLDDPATCKLLLADPEVDVIATDNDDWTALMFACRNNRPRTVEILLRDGRIPVDAVDDKGKSAFVHACAEGFDDVVELFCRETGADILNQTDVYGDTGLMKACFAGHAEVVERLLKHDLVDVNVQNLLNSETAFTYACAKSDVAVIKLLVSCARVDLSLRNKDGETGFDLCNWTAKQVVQKAIVDRERIERSRKQGVPVKLETDTGANKEGLDEKSEALLSKLRVKAGDVKYDDTTMIAHGGFGKVYRGTLRKVTKVAVKVLFASANDPKGIEMFRNEVAVWGGLTQRNILPLLAYCESPPMMISEFVSDGDMRSKLESMGWNQDKGIEYLAGVAAGMAFLHSFNVLHGDLKCANVMIDRDVPKITDFGLAKLREHITSSSSAAAVGSAEPAGTAGFMSPEYCETGKLRPPVDVFAFAMQCYEVVSRGDYPFRAPSRQIIMLWVMDGKRPSRPYDSTDRMWSLMKWAWSHEPKDRPTFEQIQDEMARWAAGGGSAPSGWKEGQPSMLSYSGSLVGTADGGAPDDSRSSGTLNEPDPEAAPAQAGSYSTLVEPAQNGVRMSDSSPIVTT